MEFMSKLSVAEDSLDETDCTTQFEAWINLADFNKTSVRQISELILEES